MKLKYIVGYNKKKKNIIFVEKKKHNACVLKVRY